MTASAQRVAQRFAARRKAPKKRQTAAKKKLAEAAEAAFLKADPALAPFERATPEKAAKSFGKDTADAFEAILWDRLERWAEKVANDETPVKMVADKDLDHKQSSITPNNHYGPETTYFCDIYFPYSVEVIKPVRFTGPKVTQHVLAYFTPTVELENDRDIDKILADSGVQRAIEPLLANVCKTGDFSGHDASYGPLADKAEELAYDKANKESDSSDDSEVQVGIEGHMRLDVSGSEWEAKANGMIVVLTLTLGITGRVLWPGEPGYDQFM